jgi:hypothetical protein
MRLSLLVFERLTDDSITITVTREIGAFLAEKSPQSRREREKSQSKGAYMIEIFPMKWR